MTQLPTDIAAISQLEDGAVRNLLITQRYRDLSAALVELLGGPGNVNWSTFATWASKTAGLSIRNEEVPGVVVELADDRSFLVAPIRETLGTVSTSIAAGNLKVFAELAPLFVKFVQAFDAPGADADRVGRFVDTLDPRPSADGGQAPLIGAFTAYGRARSTQDAIQHARLMLLGNCLIGLHEQTRLQPQIQEAMDAPIDDILKKHLSPGPGGGWLARVVGAIERPLDDLVGLAQDVWERVATRYMMSLSLPGGTTLPLGRDIPPSAAAREYLPQVLEDIDDPDALVHVLEQFDRAQGYGDQGSASVDWRVLDDRMNFIVNLFRSRQQDSELLEQPFNEAQRADIEARRMPAPALGKL
jgi:hypothetical protein